MQIQYRRVIMALQDQYCDSFHCLVGGLVESICENEHSDRKQCSCERVF